MSDPLHGRAFADAARLHSEYYAKIYRYVKRKARNRDAIDDLVAQVFLKAVEALAEGKGPQSHESSWIYRIAHNLIIDEYRWCESRQQVDIDEVNESLVADDAAMDDDAIDIRMAIGSSARRLTPEQAAAFALWADGYTGEELGELLDTTPGAAKALVRRAKDKIIPELVVATGRKPSTTTIIEAIKNVICVYGPSSTRQISQRSRIGLEAVAGTIGASGRFVPVGTTQYRRATLLLYGLVGVHDGDS